MAIIGTQSDLIFRSKQSTPLPIASIDGNLNLLQNVALTTTGNYLYFLGDNGPHEYLHQFDPIGINNISTFQSSLGVTNSYYTGTLSVASEINMPGSTHSWIFDMNNDWVGNYISLGLYDTTNEGSLDNPLIIQRIFVTGNLSLQEIEDFFNAQPNTACTFQDERLIFTYNDPNPVPCRTDGLGKVYTLILAAVNENNELLSLVGGLTLDLDESVYVQCYLGSTEYPIQVGSNINFLFDGNYYAIGAYQYDATDAKDLWNVVKSDPFFGTPNFSLNRNYILNIQPWLGSQIFNFKILGMTTSTTQITATVSGSYPITNESYELQTTMISGPTASSWQSLNALSNKFGISIKVEEVGGRPKYVKVGSANPAEYQFNYNILMSTQTFVSLDLNPNVKGIKSSWISELQGLINSGIKQNLSVTDVNNTNNTIVFEVSSITEVSSLKVNILGKLVSESGTIIDSTACVVNFMTPVLDPGAPILQYNGGFWYNDDFDPHWNPPQEDGFDPFSYQPASGYFKEVTYKSLQDQQIGPYEFKFSHTGADNATINYGAWFDNIITAGGYADPDFHYGDGQSILHIVEYNPNNTSPTNSGITRADFRIIAFGYDGPTPTGLTYSLAQCFLISGQGKLTDYPDQYPYTPPTEDLGPRLFFASITIVPIVGSRSGTVGPTGSSSLVTLNRNSYPENFQNSFDYDITSGFDGYSVSISVNQFDGMGMTMGWVQSLCSLYDSGITPVINIVQSDNSSAYVSSKVSGIIKTSNKIYFIGLLISQGDAISYLSDGVLSYFPYNDFVGVPLIPSNGSFWTFAGTTASGPSPSSGQFLNRGNLDRIIVGNSYSFDFSVFDNNLDINDYSSWFHHLYTYGNSGQSILHLTEYDPSNTNPTSSLSTKGDFSITSFNGTSSSMNVVCLSGRGYLSDILFSGETGAKLYFVSYTLAPIGGGSSVPTREDVFTSVTFSTVNHNFGYYPSVQILNEDGEVFIPQSIIHTSTASFDVYFSQVSSGTIISSGGGGNLDNVLMLTTDPIPTTSASAGNYGETRIGIDGSIPYLYVYTDQWYRFMGATF